MLWVGLTGGIGAGKSAVSQELVRHGAALVDADVIAREVVAPGSEGLAAVASAFGREVLRADGALDREALGKVVFGDEDARRRLNGIVHPLIGARTGELARAAEAAGVFVLLHDVPLLVENGLAPAYHLVVVVEAPEEERLRRLTELRGMTAEDARARMGAQASDVERAAVADVLLRNDSSREALAEQVDALWEQRLLPYAENVAAGVPGVRAASRLGGPDARWAVQGKRLVDRLRFVLGGRAGAVEHVGATAVAGLPAPDVIELQIETDQDVSDVLGGAGFPLAEDGLHRNADPGRPVDVHVRSLGDAAAGSALRLRDGLRQDRAAREAYTEVVRSVTNGGDEQRYRAALAAAQTRLERPVDSEQ